MLSISSNAVQWMCVFKERRGSGFELQCRIGSGCSPVQPIFDPNPVFSLDNCFLSRTCLIQAGSEEHLLIAVSNRQWVFASTSYLRFGSSFFFDYSVWHKIQWRSVWGGERSWCQIAHCTGERERESTGSGRPLVQLIFDPAPVFLWLFVWDKVSYFWAKSGWWLQGGNRGNTRVEWL